MHLSGRVLAIDGQNRSAAHWIPGNELGKRPFVSYH